MVDVRGFAKWLSQNITMNDIEEGQDGLDLDTSINGAVANPETPEDAEEDVSVDDDVIWIPNDQELRNALVRNGTIPEEPNLDENSNGQSGMGLDFPPIRLSDDIEIVFETPRPNCVFLRCVDEVSPFDREKGNGAATLRSDQVQSMVEDLVEQILDGIGVDQNGNKPLADNDRPEIVYEAVGPDEVEIGETLEVEQDDNASLSSDNTSLSSGEVEEGEVICVEDDSNDVGFEAVNPVAPRPERDFKEFDGDDAEEKADLEDEGWEVQKNLRTDLERLKYAQRAFGNCIPTDPTRCLTFHGYAKISREQKDADHFPVESMTEEVLVKKWMDTKIQNGRIYNENVPGLSSSTFGSPEVGSRKRKANDGHEIGPQKKRQRITFDIIEKKMWQMLNLVKRPLFTGGYGDNTRSFSRYVGHYKSGLNETREFLNFYDDKNNNTLVDSEFGHMEAYELLYKQFVTIYGPNTSEECKDCSYHEEMKVYHPY